MTSESSMILSMRRIHELVIRRANLSLKEFDLTISQAVLIFYALNSGREFVYQRELEKYFDLSHPTVIGLLKRLSENHYVTVSVDESDKRQRKVFLTERAHSIAADMEQQLQVFEHMLTETLSEQEVQTMQKCLQVIFRNLSEEVE